MIHTGINKAVNCIKTSAKPSTPKIMVIFKTSNQWLIAKNWNCVLAESKKKSKDTLMFNIKSDQNSEKLRMKLIFVLFTNDKTKHPIKGKIISPNNIWKR